jgi:hypothetical protein
MTDERLSLLAPRDEIVPIIAFGRGFLVEFQPRSSWLRNFAIRWCDFAGRAGAGVFSDTLNIRKSYALGSLVTVFQTEVYAIFACSDFCRSANMHNMMICICSDSKAALLALSSYTYIYRLNFYTSAGYHCKISIITTG